eukprot:SAG31_NODE_4026_length_3653_cov_19.795442_1_plen_63_part_00
MGDERFDGLLLTMCQGLNDMDAILNTFFSFLRLARPIALSRDGALDSIFAPRHCVGADGSIL